jgi:predicted acylesterase/phospholipase RssA
VVHSFDRIALSLSGGGYRATAFHLGVLALLDRTGLLPNVRALSTASGGTIAGAFYAQCAARGVPFDSFARELYGFLRDVDVVDAALAKPAGGKLITAAADVYATLIDATLEEIRTAGGPLAEISFNATDLANGLLFRFLKTISPRRRSGHARARVPDEVAGAVRLADVVAASSCFPAAFEPIVFPDDFRGVPPAEPRVPLMDAGIFDNLGLEGLLLVRLRDGIDHILISDADNSSPPLFDEPVRSRLPRLRVWQLALMVLALDLAALAALVTARSGLETAVAGVTALVATMGLAGASRVMRTAIANRERPLLWRQVIRLSLPQLADALRLRGGSLVALTSRVFLKRIRALMYANILRRRTPATIVEFIDDAPTEAMREIFRNAAAVPTVLWFDDERRLREVIAAGSLAACYRLLHHLERGGGPREVMERCEAVWELLTRDPFALVDPMRKMADRR